MAYDRLALIFPDFKFRAYLMAIDGSVKKINLEYGEKIHASKIK